MNNTLICNAVASYKDADIAQMLLLEKSAFFIEAFEKRPEARKVLLIKDDVTWRNWIDSQKSAVELAGVEVFFIQEESFLYNIPSAAKRALQGRKVMPLAMDEPPVVITVDELLDLEEKPLYVSGKVKKQGLIALPKRSTTKDLLDKVEVIGTIKGIYFGYPMAVFVPMEDWDKEWEITTNHVWIYNEEDCMLAVVQQLLQQYGDMTCGGCVLGYEGVFQINTILGDWTNKRGKTQDVALLSCLAQQMENQCMCDVGKKAASTWTSAWNLYRDELEAHVTKKACKASVCKKFVTYHIDSDLCTGCTDCMDVCEDEAILGKKRFVHVIDQEECTQCGKCVEACEEQAIFTAGLIKPRGPKKPVPCKK